jgi:hypothetical protein
MKCSEIKSDRHTKEAGYKMVDNKEPKGEAILD